MSFDWTEKSKERYYKKAEAAVREEGADDLLRIDKERFSTTKDKVKVYFKPIPRKGYTRRWWSTKGRIAGMQEETIKARDEYGRRQKTIFIHAYMVLEMEEQDK